jgi:hypothetical protein
MFNFQVSSNIHLTIVQTCALKIENWLLNIIRIEFHISELINRNGICMN